MVDVCCTVVLLRCISTTRWQECCNIQLIVTAHDTWRWGDGSTVTMSRHLSCRTASHALSCQPLASPRRETLRIPGNGAEALLNSVAAVSHCSGESHYDRTMLHAGSKSCQVGRLPAIGSEWQAHRIAISASSREGRPCTTILRADTAQSQTLTGVRAQTKVPCHFLSVRLRSANQFRYAGLQNFIKHNPATQSVGCYYVANRGLACGSFVARSLSVCLLLSR